MTLSASFVLFFWNFVRAVFKFSRSRLFVGTNKRWGKVFLKDNLKNQNEARLRAFNSNYALLYILNRKTALVLIEFLLNRNCLLEFSI